MSEPTRKIEMFAVPLRSLAVILASSLLACASPSAARLTPTHAVVAPGDTTGPIFKENEVTVPVRAIDFRKPVFPPDLQREGVCGWADVTYVVGTNGRAEPGSLVVVQATHRAFGTSGAAAILASTFAPATRDGKVVRQRVDQRVSFKVGFPVGANAPAACY